MPHPMIRCSYCGELMEVVDTLPYGLTYWCPNGDGRVFIHRKQLERLPETATPTMR